MSTKEEKALELLKNIDEANQAGVGAPEFDGLAKEVADEMTRLYSTASTFEDSGIDSAIEEYYSELLRNAEVVDRRGMSVDEKITINSNILVDMLRDALENALTVLRPDLWDDEEKPAPPKPGPRRA